MIVAGILGTVGGDAASFGIGLSPPGTFVAFDAVALASIVILGRRGLWTAPLAYWAIVAMVRTAGTGGGDTLSMVFGAVLRAAGLGRLEGPSYLIGIGPATLASGAAFLAILWARYVAPGRSGAASLGR